VAILFDVGGTLWPDGPRDTGILGIESRYLGEAGFLALGATRLRSLGVPGGDAGALAARLADDRVERSRVEQDTLGHVRTVLASSPWPDLDPAAVLDAICIPAREVLEPFPGTIELLRDLKAAGEQLALVSNTQWRSAARYRADFADWGIDDVFAVYVTSLDVGFRKPHPAMFEQAMDLLGADPHDTVMVGDSPTKDMTPAKALGLGTVLVAIQEPPRDTSSADRVVQSIAELRTVLLR